MKKYKFGLQNGFQTCLQKMKLSELKSADVAQLAIVEADEATTIVMAPEVADLAQLLFGFIENKQTQKT